ncbi:MAG: hypothetical protein B6D35_11145 [Candidatus Brocadia sp. UTAMX2]|jgi:hypothetical protein|nr:MAG: hypothetical protein B6D35_11145 [Candidatus Brocadia sp. UTAMX2]
MIKINKRKNDGIKGCLRLLRREIGAEIDNLVNNTAIKENHEHDFNQLHEVLKKNRNKIPLNPSGRKKQDSLKIITQEACQSSNH